MRYRNETDFYIEEELDISEVKSISLEILKEFISFCDTNNLLYFLSYGTLIGAIRHRGFVPWDDDLDVCMPREDFEKFRILIKEKNNKIGNYEVRNIYNCSKYHCRPIDRVVDSRYMCKLNDGQYYLPPWLDVFPWDGLPKNSKENKKHWAKIKKLRRRERLAKQPITTDFYKDPIILIYRAIIHFPFKLIGPKYFAKKIEKEAKKYSFNKSEYVATVVAGYGERERIPKEYLYNGNNFKYVYFEGLKCRVPYHYDKVLRHIYGDYLSIPDISNCKYHIINLWKIHK